MKGFYGFLLLIAVFSCISSMFFAQNQLVLVGDTLLGTSQNYRPCNIITDSEDDLWIAYSKSGIARFNGDFFEHFTKQDEHIPTDTIYDICISGDYIYAASFLGLFRANLSQTPITWDWYDETSGYVLHALASNSEFVIALAGSLTQITHLLKFNINDEEVEYIDIEDIYSFNPGYRAQVEFDGENNIYWGARSSNGIYKYDGSTIQQIVNIQTPQKLNSFVITNNQLWYSIFSGTIKIFNLDDNSEIEISNHWSFDSRLDYIDAYITVGLNNNICILNSENNFLQISIIGNDVRNIYQYHLAPYSNMSRSIAFKNNGEAYISDFYANRIRLVDLNNYVNFLTGYTDENFKFFDRNAVRAGVKSYGSLFWDGNGSPLYSVPHEDNTHSLFATSLWMGGFDQDNVLHVSAETFNQNISDWNTNFAFDFLPGPLKNGSTGNAGTCDTAVSEQFNRIWKIDKKDVLAHISNIQYGTNYYVSPDLYDWPAHGPVGYAELLAPFIDVDDDGEYIPENGDYPELYGDQMLWWVVNDVIGSHNSTDGIPIGIEIQYLLYGFSNESASNTTDDLSNYQTYLNMKVTHRSENEYDSVYCGFYCDADLGNPFDDYVGCDVERNSFLMYNSDNDDESSQYVNGYEDFPPIQTITFLKSPWSHPENENVLLSGFIHFEYSDISLAESFSNSEVIYNLLNGLNVDGTPRFYNTGTATEIPCKYMFPGDTDSQFLGTDGYPVPPWTEMTFDNTPGDRRGLAIMGPFKMLPGKEISIDVLFAHIPNNSESGEPFFDYGEQLDSIVDWWYSGTTPSDYNPPLVDESGIQTMTQLNQISLYPNPAKETLWITSDCLMSEVRIYNLSGKIIKKVKINSRHSQINLSSLESGMYLFEFDCGSRTERHKVIKF